jgi:hypothetical protein
VLERGTEPSRWVAGPGRTGSVGRLMRLGGREETPRPAHQAAADQASRPVSLRALRA